jgi:hypothetical protein
LKLTVDSVRDLAPIIIVIGFFQLVVLQQPIPNLGEIVVGVVLVLLGLTLFIQGLEMGLFPVGESMANAFAHKGSLFWLLAFAFALGFGTTAAEPALIAVAAEAATVAAAAGVVADDQSAQDTYAFYLRFTVAISVGIALVVGVFRILKGWPVHYLIIGGYVCVVVMTFFAPTEIIGIAYDSDDVDDHGSAGHGAGCRPGPDHPWPQSHDRRLRPDRLRQPDADDLRHGLRHDLELGGVSGR